MCFISPLQSLSYLLPSPGAAKGGGNRDNAPPLANENKKKHISKDRMKIKENLKTCTLKKVYMKKEPDKSKTRALK